MSSATLDGDTLGEKHRHFNKLVEDAISNTNYELRKVNSDDSDLDNLLKIDIAEDAIANEKYELSTIRYNDSDIDNLLKIAIASKTRNVKYIIEVMKSNDMLYAATAIKKSTWLITEPQYANIINPEYLHTQLLPSMNAKTFNKLMLHIRLHLKDETRVEAFYEYLKGSDSSYKWLQNCSIPFIENVIRNERFIPLPLFKRLCKRSARFLSYHSRVEFCSVKEIKREIMFLLKSETADVLSVLEDKELGDFPELGKRKTKILMKTCQQRVLDNFDKYVDTIDLPVVGKYLNKKEIKDFLRKQARTLGPRLYNYDTLRHFIKNMPDQERFEFVKKTFIDKSEMSVLFTDEGRRIIESKIRSYQWFEFASFEVAFSELKNLLISEKSPSERYAMFSVLITCAKRKHIKTLLQFFLENHLNETLQFKIQFVNNLLSQRSAQEFDDVTWYILNQLFNSMEVYTESDNDVQMCLESIVLHKVLNDEPVPEIIEQKLSCNAFENVRKKIDEKQRSKMFAYLLNSVLTKVQPENIANECDFSETIDQLKNTLTLLRDWEKDITDYPKILQKIQQLINIRHENMWISDMSCLYNVKKSWRKHMFEESLSLCLSEESCLNALKHKPQLLTKHDKEIDTLRTNDAVSLRRLLHKLRVYWPHSIAQHWTYSYLLHLNKPTGQKAVVRGLFTLLPQKQVIEMAQKYIPADYKIIRGKTDQADISIRKNIAQNLHVARPLIPLDTVLWYAKGDYLQYAMPSLISVLSKLSETETSRNNSARKLSGRLGLSKLEPKKRKSLILNIWNSTTNSIIKSVIFRHTFDTICQINDLSTIKELFKLLSMFFDQLSPRAGKAIVNYLGSHAIEKVPISVRIEYYMKSYQYLSSLADSVRDGALENCLQDLTYYIRWNLDILQSFDDDFIVNKLLSPVVKKFHDTENIQIFAHYVLYANTEEDQLQRFRMLVHPIMEEAFMSWRKGVVEYYEEMRVVKEFFEQLMWKHRDVILARRPSPTKLFTEIKSAMDKKMQLPENYALYTHWKLATEYAILMEQHISNMGNELWTGDNNDIWNQLNAAIIPELSVFIINCLKEDTEKYFPSIWLLVLDVMKDYINYNECKLEIYKNMLNVDNNNNYFAPCYMVVSHMIAYDFINITNDPIRRIQVVEILNKIKSHPSPEVQIHYHNDFKNIVIED